MPAHITPSAQQDNLTALADRIRIEHEAVQAAMRNGVTHALEAGDGLVQAQSQVPTGKWARWLKENCFLSIRTAQLYMQLAQHRPEIEAEISRAPDLSLRAARRLISKSKTATTNNRTDYENWIEREDQNQAQANAATKLAITLTKALRHALSLQQCEKSPSNALNGLLAKLGSRKLDLHDIAIVVRPNPRARPRPRRRAA